MSAELVQKVLASLSGKSASVRYHSQFALRRIFRANPALAVDELGKFVETLKDLDPRVLNLLAFLLSILDGACVDERVGKMVEAVEGLCARQSAIVSADEVVAVASEFFSKWPAELGRERLPMMKLLALSVKFDETQGVDWQSALLFDSGCLFARFAKGRFLNVALRTVKESEVLRKQALDFVNEFVEAPVVELAGSFCGIMESLKVNDAAFFDKVVAVLRDQKTRMAVYLIPSIMLLTDGSVDQTERFLDALVPCLTVIPFHLERKLPDQVVTDAFKAAVGALYELSSEYDVLAFLLKIACHGTAKQKLGGVYCLTCLVKLGVNMDCDRLRCLFDDVRSPYQAGVISELALALLSKGYSVMEWRNLISFLEHCWYVANTETKQFPVDVASELGKRLTVSQQELMKFLQENVAEQFQYGSIYFSLLNSWLSVQQSPDLSVIPEDVIMYICVYFCVKNSMGFDVLASLMSVTSDSKSVYEFVERLDGNVYSSYARAIMHKFSSYKQIHDSDCAFLVRLIPSCSLEEAETNCLECLTHLKDDAASHVDVLCQLFAAVAKVDCALATRLFGDFTASISKGWFIFGSSTRKPLVVKLVFDTLDMIHDPSIVPEFLQFASEHLPDISNSEQCTYVRKILRTKLTNPLPRDFPPKCCLFDFMSAASEPDDSDSFICLAVLLPMPPVCASTNFPVVTNLILKSAHITDDLLKLVASALVSSETAKDFELLLLPFITNALNNELAFSILLAILEGISGDVTGHEMENFPSLDTDVSSTFVKSCNQEYDSLLNILAQAMGTFLPAYEKTHVAVRYILVLMSRLTKKTMVQSQLSLQDATKCIAAMFNSESLVLIASLLCENLTIESVTAFNVLFCERESELLHCVQTFITNMLKKGSENLPMLFQRNETLAKAAAAMVSDKQFDAVLPLLKSSNFLKAIVDVLKDNPVQKAHQLRMLLDDSVLRSSLAQDRPLTQLIMTLTDGNLEDTVEWSETEKLSFVTMVAKFAKEIDKDKLLKVAQTVSLFDDDQYTSTILMTFGDLFHDTDFLSCFAASERYLPSVIRANNNDCTKLKYVAAIALEKISTLSALTPVIAKILYPVLSCIDLIKRLESQKNLKLLRPYMPLILSALLSYGAEVDREICVLITMITEESIEATPGSYVELVSLCEMLDLTDTSHDCIQVVIDKAKESLSAMVVLSYMCQIHLVEQNETIFQMVTHLLEDNSERSLSAGFICCSCLSFPMKHIVNNK